MLLEKKNAEARLMEASKSNLPTEIGDDPLTRSSIVQGYSALDQASFNNHEVFNVDKEKRGLLDQPELYGGEILTTRVEDDPVDIGDSFNRMDKQHSKLSPGRQLHNEAGSVEEDQETDIYAELEKPYIDIGHTATTETSQGEQEVEGFDTEEAKAEAAEERIKLLQQEIEDHKRAKKGVVIDDDDGQEEMSKGKRKKHKKKSTREVDEGDYGDVVESTKSKKKKKHRKRSLSEYQTSDDDDLVDDGGEISAASYDVSVEEESDNDSATEADRDRRASRNKRKRSSKKEKESAAKQSNHKKKSSSRKKTARTSDTDSNDDQQMMEEPSPRKSRNKKKKKEPDYSDEMSMSEEGLSDLDTSTSKKKRGKNGSTKKSKKRKF